jgi:hypothetical protein
MLFRLFHISVKNEPNNLKICIALFKAVFFYWSERSDSGLLRRIVFFNSTPLYFPSLCSGVSLQSVRRGPDLAPLTLECSLLVPYWLANGGVTAAHQNACRKSQKMHFAPPTLSL